LRSMVFKACLNSASSLIFQVMKGYMRSFEGVWGFMLIFQVMKGFSNWCGPGFTALYAQGAVLSH
jgi:hypothetical protein